jgi:predicted RNase H-like nuclease (RuvC/YqgF family)
VRRAELAELHANTGGVLQAELEACKPGSLIYRLETRIHRHQSTISRLERDIMRLKKFARIEGPSQEVLKTNEVPEPPEEAQQQTAAQPAVPPTNKAEFPPPAAEIRPVM